MFYYITQVFFKYTNRRLYKSSIPLVYYELRFTYTSLPKRRRQGQSQARSSKKRFETKLVDKITCQKRTSRGGDGIMSEEELLEKPVKELSGEELQRGIKIIQKDLKNGAEA